MTGVVILNPPDLDKRMAARATDAFERVEACIEIYLAHFRRDPCPRETFMAVVDAILESKYGRAMWPRDRERLHMRAWNAARQPPRKRRRPGPWSHPPEILDVLAERLAAEAHDAGSKYTDGELYRSAFRVAAQRFHKDFGVKVSAASIRKHRQARKSRGGIKTGR